MSAGPGQGAYSASNTEWLHPHSAAARVSPNKWRKDGAHSAFAACPVHDDRNPSLHITERDGTLLLFCHACGESKQAAIIEAVRGKGIALSRQESEPKAPTQRGDEGVKIWVADYPYHDADGTLLYRKRRYERQRNGRRIDRSKTFSWERRAGHNGSARWEFGLAGARAPLYRSHELAARPNEDLHFAEGEKKADAISRLGPLATSLPSPKLDADTDLSLCAGRVVFVHADNDETGDAKAHAIALALAPIAQRVVVVGYPELPPAGDVADWLAKPGIGLQQLLERCEAAQEAVDPQIPPPLEFDGDIQVDTSSIDLIKGFLNPGDNALLYGPSGAGKTFFTVDIAYHIACGRAWAGRRVRPAAVLYVGLEGMRGLRHRMVAYREHFGSAGKLLARLTLHTPLDKSEAGTKGEALIIESAKALADAAGQPVRLIVIDTLSRAIAGDDENSAQDVAAYVGRVGQIARATGAAVLTVHHPGKDDARGMRGSTALFAAADVVVKISSNGDVREAAAEKVKDGVIGPLTSYRLRRVALGIDEDGDEITSCIVDHVDAPEAPRQRPMPDSQAGKALSELEELIIGGRCRRAAGHARAPNGTSLVVRADWRSACRSMQLSAEGDPESERKAFQRAVQVLERSNCIGTYGEDVWMLNAAQSMSQRGVWDMDQCPASDKAAGHEDGNNA